jgi:hypothetical protein
MRCNAAREGAWPEGSDARLPAGSDERQRGSNRLFSFFRSDRRDFRSCPGETCNFIFPSAGGVWSI